MKSYERCTATETRVSRVSGDIVVRCVEARGHNPRVQPHNWLGKAFRAAH